MKKLVTYAFVLLVGVLACCACAHPQNIAARNKPLVPLEEPMVQNVCQFADMPMGSHKSVRVAAVAEAGTDSGVLTDPDCPSKQPVWFELALQSQGNRTSLSNLIDKFGRAAVVMFGELYGPPEPDPKLPEPIRKNYHPGWGHLGAFALKLKVFHIESVAPAGLPHNERTCAEDDEPVNSPLVGWVGYTNTGEAVSAMTIEVSKGPDSPVVATTKTDSQGRFSFPKIIEGTYYVRGTKKISEHSMVAAEEKVKVASGQHGIACLVAEAEEKPQ